MAACIAVSHGLVLAPWAIRNHVVLGDFSVARIGDSGLVLKAAMIEAYAAGESPRGLRGFLGGTPGDMDIMRTYQKRHQGEPVAGTTGIVAAVQNHPKSAAVLGISSVAILLFDPCHVVVLRGLGQPTGIGLLSDPQRLLATLRTSWFPAIVTTCAMLWIVVFWGCVAVGIGRAQVKTDAVVVFLLVYCGYYAVVFSFGALTAGGRYRLAMVPAMAILASMSLRASAVGGQGVRRAGSV
jgi:hypothetical protein